MIKLVFSLCITHAVFPITQALNVIDAFNNVLINTLTFNLISYEKLKHDIIETSESVSISARALFILHSTYLNKLMHCFTYKCFTRLFTVNIIEKIIKFVNCIIHFIGCSKNNIPKLTTTSKLKFIFFRLLVLLFYVSSFSQVSAISFHSNFKNGIGTIRTKYGLLRGIVVRDSPLVEAYLGIPYASPPIGSLRFMPPITPSSWKEVRNADRFSPVCPQTVPMPPNGPEALLEVPRARLIQFRRLLPLLRNQSEDCLYLNVYMPIKPTLEPHKTISNTTTKNTENHMVGEKLSTVLFIHGESYEWNSGNPYDGSELAANGNVIVVTINFRLGILGFLKTGGKESAQGNFGLMDLVAGLHWLKENLPAFGGDSSKITIMGHGTGAALANILLVSPVSSDLIKRAVLISGSALSPWAIQRSPLYVKRRVAEQTGCHGDLLYDDMAPCLRTKKLSDLLAVKVDYPRFLSGFAPFVDGTVIVPNKETIATLKLPLGSAVVSTSGIEFASFSRQNLIFGLTSVESYLDVSAQDLEFGLNETRRDRILRTYVRNVFHYHLNEIFAVLKNEYTDWEKTIRNPYSSRDAILSFLSDGHTASHLIKIGYMHSLLGGQSYFMHFKHKTGEEEYPLRSGSVRGEDVPFWLGLPLSPLYPQNFSVEEQRLSAIMVKYLSNFIKTGNPNQFTTISGKDNRTRKHLLHDSSDPYGKKRPNAKNTTDNNLETNYIALQKKKRRALIAFDLDHDPPQEQQKQSHVQLGYPKLQRNMSKIPQGRNANIYSNIHKKHISFDEMQNDDVNGKVRNIYEPPHWETYDSVNQFYLEFGIKGEHQSHYRGHKLSMWLNLVPQLHKHSYLNDISMSHHQFAEENMEFYDGNIRSHSQIVPTSDETDLFSDKKKANDRINTIQTDILSFSHKEATTDCNLNTTQFPPVVSSTTLKNNSNASESSPNVLENMDVLRRLSGKQLQSYTTALVATVAVGCFLLVLNVLIFAGIYHQREKRAKDAQKMEQLEDNETYMNTTPTKNLLNTTSSQIITGKLPFVEYNCFDQKSIPITDKYCPGENTDETSCAEKNRVCNTNPIDLLNIKYPNDSLSVNTCNAQDIAQFNPGNKDLPLVTPYPIQTREMCQDIGSFVTPKSEEQVTNCGIPEPPPPPKSVQPNQAGILRISGTNQLNSSSKKRVHIKEISV